MNKSNWAAAVAAATSTKESKYNSKEEKACLLLQFVLEINPGGPHMQNELLPIAVYSHTTLRTWSAYSFSVINLSGAFFHGTLSCRIQTPGLLLGLVMEFSPLFST